MDYNRFSYYRANPYANNDFISVASMINRKRKQYVSQMPQGEEHYPSKLGKKIFKDKIEQSQIEHQHILQSPERYPFENRIALDKAYRRNLDTIDIEGAASGTKMSESIRNKHKALIQLQKQNKLPQVVKNIGVGESLDEVYQQKRRQLAEKLSHNNNQKQKQLPQSFLSSSEQKYQQNNINQNQNQNSNKLNELNKQYNRYVNINSNQKYVNNVPPNAYQYEGFQRYKKPERSYSSIDRSYSNNNPNGNMYQGSEQLRNQIKTKNIEAYHQIDRNTAVQSPTYPKKHLNYSYEKGTPNLQMNINNRYKSNPQYAQNYTIQHGKRLNQQQRNRTINDGLKDIYRDRKQIRRNNPTNLSFNIAGQNALNSLY